MLLFIRSSQAHTFTVAKNAISYFLDQLNIPIPVYHKNLEVETRVNDTIRAWGLHGTINRHRITGWIIALTAYNYMDLDTIVHIALFTAIATTLDVPEVMDRVGCDTFHHDLFAGKLHDREDLPGQMVKILAATPSHYSQIAASSIMASTLQFINSTLLENTTRDMVLSEGALPFIEHRRLQTGVAEAYAHFIWDKKHFPSVATYIQAIPYAQPHYIVLQPN